MDGEMEKDGGGGGGVLVEALRWEGRRAHGHGHWMEDGICDGDRRSMITDAMQLHASLRYVEWRASNVSMWQGERRASLHGHDETRKN